MSIIYRRTALGIGITAITRGCCRRIHLSAPNYKSDLRQGVAVEYVSCEPTDSARELFDEDCELVEEEQ